MMFMLAFLWPAALINLGLIGLAIEALTGRVYRIWLLVPLISYTAYFGLVGNDHYTLSKLDDAYDTANFKVNIPFDPRTQGIFFRERRALQQHMLKYPEHAAYAKDDTYANWAISIPAVDQSVCDAVRSQPSLAKLGIAVADIQGGELVAPGAVVPRSCYITLPEDLDRPVVQVSRDIKTTVRERLAVRIVTTKIETPDGQVFRLSGGVGTPLSVFPIPMIACGLNNFPEKGKGCSAGFMRGFEKPFGSVTAANLTDQTHLFHDPDPFVRALGMRPRPGSENLQANLPKAVDDRMALIKNGTLQRQFADMYALMTNPSADLSERDLSAIENDPGLLSSQAASIMLALETAARAQGADRPNAAKNARILVRLLAKLPDRGFQAMRPRIRQVYGTANANEWLQESDVLMQRLSAPSAEPTPTQTKDNRRPCSDLSPRLWC